MMWYVRETTFRTDTIPSVNPQPRWVKGHHPGEAVANYVVDLEPRGPRVRTFVVQAWPGLLTPRRWFQTTDATRTEGCVCAKQIAGPPFDG